MVEVLPPSVVLMRRYLEDGRSAIALNAGDRALQIRALHGVLTRGLIELRDDQWLSILIQTTMEATEGGKSADINKFVADVWDFKGMDEARFKRMSSILKTHSPVFVATGMSWGLYQALESSMNLKYSPRDVSHILEKCAIHRQHEFAGYFYSRIGSNNFPSPKDVLVSSIDRNTARYVTRLFGAMGDSDFADVVRYFGVLPMIDKDYCITSINMIHDAYHRGRIDLIETYLYDRLMGARHLSSLASAASYEFPPTDAVWFLNFCAKSGDLWRSWVHDLAASVLRGGHANVATVSGWIDAGLQASAVTSDGRVSHLVFDAPRELRDVLLSKDERSYACVSDDPFLLPEYLRKSNELESDVLAFLSAGVPSPEMLGACKDKLDPIQSIYLTCIVALHDKEFDCGVIAPQHLTCVMGDSLMLKRVCDAGFDINEVLVCDSLSDLMDDGPKSYLTPFDGYTPLLVAAENGFYDCVSVLVSKGADLNFVGKDGLSMQTLMDEDEHLARVVKSAGVLSDFDKIVGGVTANRPSSNKRSGGFSL